MSELKDFALYFKSGNSIPVERAVIPASVGNAVIAELTRLQAKVARLESDLEQMRQMGIADLKAECERLRVNARRWDYAFMNCADLDVMTVKELDEAIDAQINQSNKG